MSKRQPCTICRRPLKMERFHKKNSEEVEYYGICKDDVNELYNEFNEHDDVLLYLKELDYPFIQSEWEEAKGRSPERPMDDYINVMTNSLKYRGLSFDSDASKEMNSLKKVDKLGGEIHISDELRDKWGYGYSYDDEEILSMETFYRNMKYDYEVDGASAEAMLVELCRLSVEKERLIKKGEYTDYKRVADAYKDTLASSGFRPVDRKNNFESQGITSFGQIVERIEREGFVTPDRIEFERDDIDTMLLYYTQWAQRFSEQSVDTESPDRWRDEVDYDDELVNVDEEENIESLRESYPEEILEQLMIDKDND